MLLSFGWPLVMETTPFDFLLDTSLGKVSQMQTLRVSLARMVVELFGWCHGLSDCDRHTGSAQRHVEKWMRDVATTDVHVHLDAESLLARLAVK